MGYIYLTIALVAGVAKGFCGKTVSNDMKNFRDCIFINLLRMVFCAVIGFGLTAVTTEIHVLDMDVRALPIYGISALGMTFFCVCWMYAYKNEAYMFLSIFTMLGSIITCLFGFIFYRETIGLNKWVGMGILFFAVLIMSKYNKGIKGKLTGKGLRILVTGCLGNAVADFMQKVYMREIGTEAAVFNFYTYMFSSLGLIVVYFFVRKREVQSVKSALYDKSHVLICFVMSSFLYLNSVTKTMAAGILSTAEIYPVLQGANLILSAIMAHLLLKEKMNKIGMIGIICALVGLLVMHML